MKVILVERTGPVLLSVDCTPHSKFVLLKDAGPLIAVGPNVASSSFPSPVVYQVSEAHLPLAFGYTWPRELVLDG